MQRFDQKLWVILACVLLFAASPVWADDGAAAEDLSESLESELLEGLGDDLVEDTSAEGGSAKKKSGGASAGEDLGAAGEDDNPLVRIGSQMRRVERLIAEREALKQAPEMQEKIVQDLEALIQQIKKQQSQQQSASSQSSKQNSQRSKVEQPGQQPTPAPGKSSNQPARDASERLGPDDAQKVDMAEMQALLKDLWGHLPERTREQMLQSSVDEFLPEYEVMIEKYFRRLAEDPQREGERD